MKIVLDVETNGIGGFRPPRQRVMQLAYGVWDNATALEVKTVFVKDAGEVSPRALEVHGIALETCEAEGIALAEAVRNMCDAMEACNLIVGHNVEFDIGCILNQLKADGLHEEHDRLDRLARAIPWMCTMKAGTAVCKLPRRAGPGFKYPTLAELYTKLFGAPPACRLHDAAADCEVTAKCLDAFEGNPV